MNKRFQKISTILIWSENFRALADWYLKVFEFKVVEELDHPQDTGVLFEVSPNTAWIWIGQHSEVKGKNKDACRHMFNLSVDSVEDTYKYLKQKSVEFVAKPFKAPVSDSYFATFLDLDGNMVQIIGGK